MGNNREARRADLKKRLIEAAEAQMAEKGLSGLKAREVTTQAGCALGALYNAFEDLDMLILHVNARTLERLGVALKAAVPEGERPAEEVMQALAAGYVDFACANEALWLALFQHRLPEGREMPVWHRETHAVLIDILLEPLARLRPDMDRATLLLRARTTFAAAHGVVLLSLQGQFVGVPPEHLRDEMRGLVAAMTRGAHLAMAAGAEDAGRGLR